MLALASRVALGLAVTAWALLIVAWVALEFWIVPRAQAWRPALEAVATRALGVRVSVGAIEAATDTGGATLTLRDVRLHDARGHEALHLPRVQAALSVASLWRLGFDQLVIDGPTLEVRRLADGRLQVAGLELSSAGDDSPAADWFFGQREFALRAGVLRWIDEQRPNAPPLALTAVDLVVRNPGLRHEFRLDATPPPEWGERLSVRGRFARPFWQTHPGRWREWSGELFVLAPRLDVQRLETYLDTAALWGVRELRATGAVRLWADVRRAQWRAATADVHWSHVHAVWAPNAQARVEPLRVARMSGRLGLQRDGNTTVWATQGLAITTGDGSDWPRGDVRFEYELAPDGGLRHWALSSDRLDLGVVQRLARVLPLGEAVHHWAEQTQPAGVAEGLSVRWSAPSKPGAPERWEARGRVRGLGLRAGAVPRAAPGEIVFGRPGLEGVDAEFALDERGGRATLAMRRGALVFPGVFDDPRLAFDELSAEARWSVEGPAITLEVSRLSFANADAAGSGSVRWRTADPDRSAARDRFPGRMTLDMRLTRADAARVARYLPATVGADTRRYLQTAIRAGRVSSATFRVDGDLWDFPFADARQGVFEVRAQLNDVALDYAPRHLLPAGSAPWPALERAAGELLIERRTLQILRAGGSVAGQPALRVLQAEAALPDYMADEPQLQVKGLIRGTGDDVLGFVAASPLREFTGSVLDVARASGALEVALDLRMPLNDTDRTQVRGQVRLAGNDVQMRPDVPLLQGVRGVLDFTEHGFDLAQASARVLGGELRFSGGMGRRDGAAVVRFQGQGTVSAAGLAASREWGWARWLGAHAQGAARYALGLAFGPDGMDLRLDTDLRGLGVALPAPLTKPADAAWRVQVALETRPRPDAAAELTRDRLRLTVEPSGDAVPLRAEYEREHSATRTTVRRGRLALGAELPDWPVSGVSGVARLRELDADAWQALLEPDPVPVSSRASAAAGLDWRGSDAYWPSRLGVTLDRLLVAGRTFEALTAGGSREGDLWRLTVAARQLEGYLEYRSGAQEQLLARLARLELPPSAAADVERLASQPRSVPALDIVVDAFELAGRPLGRLEVQADNRDAAQGSEGPREWRLQSLRLTVPEARLSASGNWAPVAALTSPGQAASARRTALRMQLDIDDAGALLERFGFAGTLRGGRGRMEGTLGWLGSPLGLHLPSLSGELWLDVQRGQFLKADPGIAKLLGVLSLQSLPRRLTLDFRDVFSEGFAFDFVRGNARIARGVASTNNLQMKGVSAAVLIEGQADLVRETQDLTAVVVPELNAGTASLVATMINPVTGLGSFLAQWLLREPLQAAATQTFRITGAWADPQVERIRRTIPSPESSDIKPDRTP
ncbi:MAG: YhdP family protein [Tepidimonas sp.]|uniref:YhdP family protein n=1 Tax=Tepidimonas sp. TaxID=2002775 RepID=UPI00259F0821|nr:YhdP family protein [Tepidimonas sp.]MDM7456622.1 YhdP family protein [Tepidimonas sp.]